MMNDEETEILQQLADHRTFLLTLSPGAGQEMSESLGFSKASSDVQDMETVDVIAKWATFAATGTLSPVNRAAGWMSDFLSEHAELSEEEEEQTRLIYFAYSVALLAYLADSGVIDVISNGDVMDNLIDFINFMPGVISEVIVEEDDSDE